SEEHTSELQSLTNLVCRLLLEKKKTQLRRSAAGATSIQRASVYGMNTGPPATSVAYGSRGMAERRGGGVHVEARQFPTHLPRPGMLPDQCRDASYAPPLRLATVRRRRRIPRSAVQLCRRKLRSVRRIVKLRFLHSYPLPFFFFKAPRAPQLPPLSPPRLFSD